MPRSNPISGLSENLASLTGTYAEDWIQEKIDKGEIKADAASTKSFGLDILGTVMKSGINKIFGALTGTLNKKTTVRSDLKFSTRGEFGVSGDLSFSSTNPAMSLRALFTEDKVGKLGVWNLAEQPTVYASPLADYTEKGSNKFGYNYNLRGVTKYDYDLLINPDLEPYIIKKWADVSLIYLSNRGHIDRLPDVPDCYADFGSIGGWSGASALVFYGSEHNCLYDSAVDSIAYFDNDLVYRCYTEEIYQIFGEPVPIIYVPDVKIFEFKHYALEDIEMKVTLNLVTEIEGQRDTTVSTRTFIPKIEWDPAQLEDFSNFMEQLKIEHGVK